jgi:hypothetical protein
MIKIVLSLKVIFTHMLKIKFGVGVVSARAAMHYDSGSIKIMLFLAAPAPQHCLRHLESIKKE